MTCGTCGCKDGFGKYRAGTSSCQRERKRKRTEKGSTHHPFWHVLWGERDQLLRAPATKRDEPSRTTEPRADQRVSEGIRRVAVGSGSGSEELVSVRWCAAAQGQVRPLSTQGGVARSKREMGTQRTEDARRGGWNTFCRSPDRSNNGGDGKNPRRDVAGDIGLHDVHDVFWVTRMTSKTKTTDDAVVGLGRGGVVLPIRQVVAQSPAPPTPTYLSDKPPRTLANLPPLRFRRFRRFPARKHLAVLSSPLLSPLFCSPYLRLRSTTLPRCEFCFFPLRRSPRRPTYPIVLHSRFEHTTD